MSANDPEREGGSAGGSDFDRGGYSAPSSFGQDRGTENHNDHDPVKPERDEETGEGET